MLETKENGLNCEEKEEVEGNDGGSLKNEDGNNIDQGDDREVPPLCEDEREVGSGGEETANDTASEAGEECADGASKGMTGEVPDRLKQMLNMMQQKKPKDIWKIVLPN